MYQLTRGFSRQHRIMEFAATATHHLSGYTRHGFTYATPYRLTPVQPLTGPTTFLRHPIACLLPTKVPCSPIRSPEGDPSGFGWLVQLIQHGRGYTGTGISTRCPSTTPVGLALGPDSPWADWPGPGTLGLSAGKVLTCLIATHACILTPTPSTTSSRCCFTGCRTLPYPAPQRTLPRLRRCA